MDQKLKKIMKEYKMKESLEQVKAKYKLTEEEHNRIGEEIIKIMLYNRYPVSQPTAVINIAPPASGKTGLNSYGNEQFGDNNVVIINSDELKPFHPKIDEIAKLYPQYYTKVTDQESNTWTSDLFDTALREGYNVIFEGTGRNARILETIKEKMKKYRVIVRGMAVNELNCLISLLERYEYQVDTRGWGRLVTLDHFYETYNEMPNTIDVIEKSGIVASCEVYRRGMAPNKPVKIYDSIDQAMGRFPNAKYAVLGGRNEDEKFANQDFENRISNLVNLLNRKDVASEEREVFSQITQLHSEFSKKKLDDSEIGNR